MEKGICEVFKGGICEHNIENHWEHAIMYGLLVLALSSAFFDIRLEYLCSTKLFERLEFLTAKAKQNFDYLYLMTFEVYFIIFRDI